MYSWVIKWNQGSDFADGEMLPIWDLTISYRKNFSGPSPVEGYFLKAALTFGQANEIDCLQIKENWATMSMWNSGPTQEFNREGIIKGYDDRAETWTIDW